MVLRETVQSLIHPKIIRSRRESELGRAGFAGERHCAELIRKSEPAFVRDLNLLNGNDFG
jgi:hypothetical protein